MNQAETLKIIHDAIHLVINELGVHPIKGDKMSDENDFYHIFERDFSTEDKTIYYLIDC